MQIPGKCGIFAQVMKMEVLCQSIPTSSHESLAGVPFQKCHVKSVFPRVLQIFFQSVNAKSVFVKSVMSKVFSKSVFAKIFSQKTYF